MVAKAGRALRLRHKPGDPCSFRAKILLRASAQHAHTTAMATATLIPVSEYLETSYRPDRDYVDGEVRERNVGEQPHGNLQIILGGIFREHRLSWGVRPLGGTRVQITPERFRVPDVCVVRSNDPKDLVIRFAPLLCIEILSRGDSLTELQERVDDYTSLGVQHIWAIDPWKRRAWYCSTRGFEQPADGILLIAGTPIAITLAGVFAELDEN